MSEAFGETDAERRARLVKRGKGHYTLDGVKVPSVTTILDGLPKPGLKWWAANVTAQTAVEEWEELSGLGPVARYERLKKAHTQTLNTLARRGTQIHALGEAVAHGREVDVPDDLVGPVQAMARALDRWQIETVATETPLANTEYGIAGTADLWGKIGRLGTGLVLLDTKTGSGVYESDALQLCAYAHMDLWHPEPGREEAAPQPEACYVLHVLPDDVELVPIEGAEGAAMFREFLYVKATWQWLQAIKADPIIGEALVLEEAG